MFRVPSNTLETGEPKIQKHVFNKCSWIEKLTNTTCFPPYALLPNISGPGRTREPKAQVCPCCVPGSRVYLRRPGSLIHPGPRLTRFCCRHGGSLRQSQDASRHHRTIPTCCATPKMHLKQTLRCSLQHGPCIMFKGRPPHPQALLAGRVFSGTCRPNPGRQTPGGRGRVGRGSLPAL